MRLRLTIAYDGRPYLGWQTQPGGRGIQDHIKKALAALLELEELPRVFGSGRTDAGVHALGQMAHCDVPDGRTLSMDDWRRALNRYLAPDIRIMLVEQVAEGFHARFDAVAKTYLYQIWHAPVLPPHYYGHAWHIPQAMDFELLRTAALCCRGTHDFSKFTANRGEAAANPASTIRTIFAVDCAASPSGLWTLRFRGSGFLYRMVRLLTGSIVRVARGKEPVDWMRRLLEDPHCGKSHFLAPSDGLYLEKVDYS